MRGDFVRGILASVYTDCDLRQEEAEALYRDFYADAAFTFVAERPIDLKQAVYTNKAVVQVAKYGRKLHIVSAIDNLLKGASGQAVQNMNLLFGLDEREGLRLKASAYRRRAPGPRIKNRNPPPCGRPRVAACGGEPWRASDGGGCGACGSWCRLYDGGAGESRRRPFRTTVCARDSRRRVRRRTVLWRACCSRLPKASSSGGGRNIRQRLRCAAAIFNSFN